MPVGKEIKTINCQINWVKNIRNIIDRLKKPGLWGWKVHDRVGHGDEELLVEKSGVENFGVEMSSNLKNIAGGEWERGANSNETNFSLKS